MTARWQHPLTDDELKAIDETYYKMMRAAQSNTTRTVVRFLVPMAMILTLVWVGTLVAFR